MSEFLVHFDRKGKNIWRSLPDKLCNTNHVSVLSSCKIMLLSVQHSIVKIYCLRTGRETEIQHKINELTEKIVIHTFSETRMFCIEENIHYYIYLTYYPYDEACPFGQEKIHFHSRTSTFGSGQMHGPLPLPGMMGLESSVP